MRYLAPSVSKAEWQRALSVIVSVNDCTGSPFSGQAVRLAAEQEARKQVCTEHFQSGRYLPPPLWPESMGPREELWAGEDTRRFKGHLTQQFLSILSETRLWLNKEMIHLQNWVFYIILNIFMRNSLASIRPFMNHTIITVPNSQIFWHDTNLRIQLFGTC